MTPQNINDAGLKLIEEFEGLRLTAYNDGGGVWTIGYGHTKGVKRGQTISRDQAEQFLREDVSDAEAAVNRLALKLSANQFSALVSFTFNLGAGGLQKLVSHGFENIAERMLLFDHDNGKRIAGLTRRRQAERALFLAADAPDNEKP